MQFENLQAIIDYLRACEGHSPPFDVTDKLYRACHTLHGSANMANVERGVAVAGALLLALLTWVLYGAIEPYVRRLWPHALISWNRMLRGRWRDSRVGRDLLVGACLGLAVRLVGGIHFLVPAWVGLPMHYPAPLGQALQVLGGARQFVAEVPGHLLGSILTTMFIVLGLLTLRLTLRRDWLAVGAMVVFVVGMGGLDFDHLWVDVLLGLVRVSLVLVALLRFGLLALAAMQFFIGFSGFLLSPDVGGTYGWITISGLAVLLLVAGYACVTSMAGRQLFRDVLDEERAATAPVR